MLCALMPLALLAAGCGIRATDVVEAGEPALVQVVPAGQLGTVLYFVSSSTAARPMPVVRDAGPWGEGTGSGSGGEQSPAGAVRALDMLFAGPSRPERDAGLRSELPEGRVKLSVELSAQGVQVRMDAPVNRLSEPARQQLICTAAQARTADRSEAVTVTGTDGVIGPAHCSV
ncbi:hypothetical protein ACIBI8_08325 [Streptomyces sp. NPDC050529]|uniref:hypothetical protein n=1 Tax=unclassified Streptomyces TaxID=2593676 RepID=UPI002DD9B516|nr:hypothetical protein [Streptomyces sp. NBC_01022]WRZ85636.1 hypothetical protein OG316_37855 [Streptomyces sp. NBC_01022]